MNPLYQEALRLHQAGQIDAAEQRYLQLLLEHPENPDLLHLLGVVALQKRDFRRAVELIEAALTRNPDASVYHHNIGAAYRVLGAFERAESHYRRAIALQPDYAEAYFNLSAVRRFSAADEEILNAIELQLGAEAVGDEDRAFLHFAAGKLCDDLQRYDEAFAHYAKGNPLLGSRFDPDAHDRFIAAIQDVFQESLFEQLAGCGVAAELPVFVVGMPRSGTTLVEQILASHPEIHGAGELPDLQSIVQALPRHAAGVDYPRSIPKLPPQAFQGFGEAFLRRLSELAGESSRCVDKMPGNFLHLGLIALMLPKARVVHCQRDPVDTCLSCYFQRFRGGQDYAQDLRHLGRYYRAYEQLMAHWRRVLPIAMYEVQYEQLVAEPEPHSRALIEFMGLPWDDACLRSHEADRPVTTASNWQVRRPVYQSSVARWRRYESHVGPLLAALGK